MSRLPRRWQTGKASGDGYNAQHVEGDLSGRPADDSPAAPDVSVVIPIYNEASTIHRLLRALDHGERRPTEIVCVDAGSGDGTSRVIEGFDSQTPIRLLRTRRLNPGQARNHGVRAAQSEWIAFVDAGTTPETSWLRRLMAEADESSSVVFGTFEPASDTFFRRCAALAYVPARTSEGIRGPTVASMLLRRSTFEAVGGFPAFRAAEDLIFLERLHDIEPDAALAPEAVVSWETAGDVKATFRRFALYSNANLEAGRGRFWHRGLARQYASVCCAILATTVAGAGLWSVAIVPAWLMSRALKAAWRKRRDLAFPVFRPDYVLGTAAMLVLLDAATWAGAMRWVACRLNPAR